MPDCDDVTGTSFGVSFFFSFPLVCADACVGDMAFRGLGMVSVVLSCAVRAARRSSMCFLLCFSCFDSVHSQEEGSSPAACFVASRIVWIPCRGGAR